MRQSRRTGVLFAAVVAAVSALVLTPDAPACRSGRGRRAAPVCCQSEAVWIDSAPCGCTEAGGLAGEKQNICLNQPVPAGWVIIGYTADNGCPSSSNMAKVILNTNGMPVGSMVPCCANQTFPWGWAQVGTETSIGCGSGANNVAVIKRLN